MLMTVFVVLMILWLFGGGYLYWGIGGHLLAWCCVAILGWYVFGGSPPPAHLR